MKGYILSFIFLLSFVGCRQAVEPTFEEPPIGTAYITVEYEGKRSTYIEGKNATPGGSFGSIVKRPDITGHGGSLTNPTDGTSWSIQFYDKVEKFEENTGNFTKLFDAGTYDYLLLDEEYNVIGNKGVIISTSFPMGSNGNRNTTEIQNDGRSRQFEVKRVYFYNLTYDRFIWVEGTFDTWMSGDKKAKGQFRIKIQHDLQ